MTEIKRDDRGREQVKAWYALAVTTGREKVIRERLKNLAKNEKWKDQIFRVVIPFTKEIGETGKIKEIAVYKQVVYVEMILNDDTYNAVKIDGVRHILGEPTPIPEEEMKIVFEKIGMPYESNEEKVEEHEIIVITDESKGAFFEQEGKVVGYDPANGEYEVVVNLLGKDITVNLTRNQFKQQK